MAYTTIAFLVLTFCDNNMCNAIYHCIYLCGEVGCYSEVLMINPPKVLAKIGLNSEQPH